MVSRALSTTKSGTNTFVSQAETSTSSSYRALLIRGISEPLAAGGNTGGNITTMFARNESSTNMNAKRILHVYATVGNSDTVRGTLLSTNVDATEWPTTLTGGTDTIALSTVAVQAGDRIVIEVGFEAQNTSSTSMTGTMRYGGTDATDLTASTTGVTTRSPYVEFSGMDALFTAPKPKIETLSDDFTTDARASKWPDSYGTTAVSGGVATVTSDATNQYSGLQTSTTAANQYSLIDSYMKVKINFPAGSTGEYAEFTAMPLPANGTDINVNWDSSGTVTFGLRSAYSFSSSSTLNAGTNTSLWVGIAEGSGRSHFGTSGTTGNLYFYSSTDGTNWTQRHTVATPAYANSITAILATGRDTSGTIAAGFDNFNVDAPPTGFSGNLDITRTIATSVSGDKTAATDSLNVSVSRSLTVAQRPSDVVIRQPINTSVVDLGTTTAVVGVPITAEVGDALFYIYHSRSLASAEHSTPAGFTQLLGAASATRGSVRIAWRPVVEADLGANLTFTSTNLAAVDGRVTLLVVSGVDTSNLIAHSEAPGAGAGAGTQFSFPTRTPTTENATYLYGGVYWNPSSAVAQSAKSSSIATNESVSAGAANQVGTYIASEPSYTQTAYPARVFQVNTASTNAVTWTMVLRPAPKGWVAPGTSERYYDMSTVAAAVNAATTVTDLNTALNQIETDFNIGTFVVNTTSTSFGTRSWDNPAIDDVNLKSAVINTLDALAKYPVEFIRRASIATVAFVKNIVNAEKPEADIGGFNNNSQIFLDIDNNTTTLSFGYLFHHELEHAIGNVFAQYREYFENEWIALNPPGFTYLGNSYNDVYTGDWPEGFVRPYARYSFGEDMAEVHAMLFSTSKQALLAEQVAEDPYIAAKVALMKRWLKDRSWGRIDGDTYYTQINIPTSESHTGSLTVTRTIASSFTGTPAIPASLSRALTAATTVAGTPALSNSLSRSLTAATTVAGAPSFAHALSRSLTAATSVAGTPNPTGALSVAATRTLTFTGTPTITSALSVAATAATTANGSPAMAGSVNVALTRALTLGGTPATSADLSRSLATQVTYQPTVSFAGNLNVSATRSLGSVGIPTVGDAISRSLTRTLSYTGAPMIIESLPRSLTAAITLAGTPAIPADLTVTRTRVLTFGGTPATTGTLSAALTTSLFMTGEGFQIGEGALTVVLTRALTMDGTANITGTIDRTLTRSLTLSGSPSTTGTLTVSASRSLSNGGAPNPAYLLALSLATALTAAGNPALENVLDIEHETSLLLGTSPSVTGTIQRELSTMLQLAGSTDNSGTINRIANRALTLDGTPNITSLLQVDVERALSFDAALATAGDLSVERTRTLDLSGSPSWTGTLNRALTGSTGNGGTPAIPSGLSVTRTRLLSLAASGIAMAGTLNLSGTRVLTLEGVAQAEGMGTLNLSLARSLNLSGAPNVTAPLNRTLTRTLTVSGTPSLNATLARAGNTSLALSASPQTTGTLVLEHSRTLTLDGALAAVGNLDLSLDGTLTLDGVPLITGTLIIAPEIAITLTGAPLDDTGVQMFLKDGTRLHAFILVDGILVPVVPNFRES